MIVIFDERKNRITYKELIFSGGEVHVNLNDPVVSKTVSIFARLDSSNEVMKLFLLTDALRNRGASLISLTCPYLPYARQDRECAPGDAFSLKVFADMLNAQNYTAVKVADPHSKVAEKLINNLVVLSTAYFASSILTRIPELDHIVCPDEGAVDRVETLLKCATELNLFRNPYSGTLNFAKVRCPKTGNITEIAPVSPLGSLRGKTCLIVDDICDGGATFKAVSDTLRRAGAHKVILFVTHGILSRGVEATGCDQVLTTDSIEPKDDGRVVIFRFHYFGGVY